jgi:hypothetical protein
VDSAVRVKRVVMAIKKTNHVTGVTDFRKRSMISSSYLKNSFVNRLSEIRSSEEGGSE